MKVLIIEDELSSANRIKKILEELNLDINVQEIIETVEDGINWFKTNQEPDLVIADIQLSDGLSFEIFKQIRIESYIVFTTAYNEYAIEAFKVNSIDYLLKPIDRDELAKSIQKYLKISKKNRPVQSINLDELMKELTDSKPRYKSRFLVKHRQSFLTIFVEEIMYFYIEDQLVFLTTKDDKKFLIEQTLNELELILNPDMFFRINRQMIISIYAIKKIDQYFNSRLLLEVTPPSMADIIVSREKVGDFKQWVER